MTRVGVLTSQAEDFPRWYQDVLEKAELADNGPARGTMVIRPYAYSLWERMQGEIDRRIKAAGAENVYLPLFIPESHLNREAEHVDGFSPELAIITHAGGRELTESLVVRPTSETVFGEFMAKWVQSHRDLPMLLNQWANVVRWELRPRIFLRTSEFLWQEGHTAHASEEDASAYARKIHLEVYRDFIQNVLAIPVKVGFKTTRERFAGATNTMTCEAMMGDRKALQMATSHELGQNFARAFNIVYTGIDGHQETCWTTSWGSSTRQIGGLIMAHGDDKGLRIPPRIAPVQAVIIAVRDDGQTLGAARRIHEAASETGVRVKLDERTDQGFGRRSVEWELKGVPLRIEVGPRDLAQGRVTVVRRDSEEKTTHAIDSVAHDLSDLLESVQGAMLNAATERLRAATAEVRTISEAAEAAQTGWAQLPWADLGEDGERILNEAGVSVRCLQNPDGTLPQSTTASELEAVIARSY